MKLETNNLYSKEEIEQAFETNFGSRIKGITLRWTNDDEPYILLFATVKGQKLYGDRISGNIFYYKGEGLEGDQRLTAANKALTNANRSKAKVYGFRQEEEQGKYCYLGLIQVEDWAYVNDNGRKAYEFRLRQVGIADLPEKTQEGKQILDITSQLKPTLTDNSQRFVSITSQIARSAAFRLQVKEIYENRCAICNKQRFTAAGYPEVQAAHIYPKEKNGSDDLRNGIALCRLHHWAFDSGLMALTDDLFIIVKKELIEKAEYEEIYSFQGKKISLPNKVQYIPDGIFASAHRKLHGFE